MQINPYLFYNSNCEAAFKFYEKALGGKIVSIMTYGDTPMGEQTSDSMKGAIRSE